MCHRLKISAGLFLLLTSISVFADDLGEIGPVYQIQERDLLKVIQEKLEAAQKTGELARIEEDYKRQVIHGIERPRPIKGISPTETARTFYIDPTYVLPKNMVDEKGKLIYPAGTTVNPFDYDSLTKVLLFFDASDKKQVAFAKKFMAESKLLVKPILVAGEPLKLMREWKQQVYYDQGGALSRRFNISQVPAVVSQEGRQLRVDEIRP
jgi:conjugal transfer pilus assembly protein TraW